MRYVYLTARPAPQHLLVRVALSPGRDRAGFSHVTAFRAIAADTRDRADTLPRPTLITYSFSKEKTLSTRPADPTTLLPKHSAPGRHLDRSTYCFNARPSLSASLSHSREVAGARVALWPQQLVINRSFHRP